MSNQNLSTFQVHAVKSSGEEGESRRELGRFPNMLNASIIQGKLVELEHSRLAGPTVKFKTVINYDKTLEPNETLGLTLLKQDQQQQS